MFYRDSYTVINLDKLKQNIQTIYNHTKKDIMAVVKADAYGCGYKEVSRALHEIPYVKAFAVATLKEAVELRNAKIDKDILVLGAIVKNQADIDLAVMHDISLTVFSLEYAKYLVNALQGKSIKVHVKLDTGMNRIGLVDSDEYKSVIEYLNKNNIVIEGVFTHFATADSDVKEFQKQKDQFYKVIDGINCKYIHCENSAAIMYHNDDKSNLVRAGIAMYGVDPAGKESTELKQVLSLYSKVAMIKKIHKGEYVGYGYTYQALKDEFIATLPIGYADGVIRKNQGRNVYINGKYYPIVGRVCMDQLMVRVDGDVQVDDIVEIFGDHITLATMAKELDTIPYEVMCLISKRVERIYEE